MRVTCSSKVKILTSLRERELRRVRRRLSLVFQESALFDSMSVFDNVAFPLREAGDDEERVAEEVREKLEMVGLEEEESALPAQLSGGMKKRVALARGLATKPEVLLYDEPTAGLDPSNTRRVIALIARLRSRIGVTSVMVTHDLQSAFAIADRMALLVEGRIIEAADVESFRSSRTEEVRAFLDGGSDVRCA